MSRIKYHTLCESDKEILRNMMRKLKPDDKRTNEELDNHLAGNAFICGEKEIEEQS